MLILDEKLLQEDKKTLYSKNILTEKLLESVLFSINKHAKDIRDNIKELKYSMDGFYTDDVYDELKTQEQQKDNSYHIKSNLIKWFLSPSYIHIDIRYNPYLSSRYTEKFYYYRTKNCSFHLPVYGNSGTDLIKIPLDTTGGFYVKRKTSGELLDLNYCKEVYSYIECNREKITYLTIEYSNKRPHESILFKQHEQEIYDFLLEEFNDCIEKLGKIHLYYPVRIDDTLNKVDIRRQSDNITVDLDYVVCHEGDYFYSYPNADRDLETVFTDIARDYYDNSKYVDNKLDYLYNDNCAHTNIGDFYSDIEIYDALNDMMENKPLKEGIKEIIDWDNNYPDAWIDKIVKLFLDEQCCNIDGDLLGEINIPLYLLFQDFYEENTAIIPNRNKEDEKTVRMLQTIVYLSRRGHYNFIYKAKNKKKKKK